MRTKLLTLFLGLLVSGLWAQQDDGAKVVTASQAIQETVNSNNYTIQVGVPYLGTDNNATPTDIRFPWDVFYIFGTFSEDSFDISKGFFGDKVLLQWEIRNNFNLITSIEISRRELGSTGAFQFIGSVGPNDTQYEDKYVDGGVLYEYKVLAKGVSQTEIRYTNFITGIGFRNPTAIVTGNVNFKGGNPVQNVTVIAESDGSVSSYGSGLIIPASNQLEVNNLNKPIATATTLQAWVRPDSPYTDDNGNAIRLFRVSEKNSNNLDVTVNLKEASKTLEIDIAGSLFVIENVYPSGDVNTRGDDIMVSVTDFNTNFMHITVQMEDNKVPLLFVNGRPMTTAYRDQAHNVRAETDPANTSPYLEITIPTQTTNLNVGSGSWTNVHIGGGNTALIDEIRVWKSKEVASDIRTDYKRYISGNDPDLIAYLSANENTGNYAYDASRNGFNYNKNHGNLNIQNISNDISFVSGAGNIPSSSQLGILGVTDANGNYEINAIPYTGTGESFKITPVFGQHKFEPNQQLVFLGEGSEVVNKIDFTDTSSFIFKGKILYDTRGVFPSFVDVNGGVLSGLSDGDEYVSGGTSILDETYNQYEQNGNFYNKGEYWLNDLNDTDADNDRLERYARIPVEGANIYIDGNIVLDENNIPIESDGEGNFDISVPIGNHFIRVAKNGHEFTYEGRFPAETGTFQEFFEDAQEQVVFIDETRVTAVGRVVGGSVEAQKPIGFGDNGFFSTPFIKVENSLPVIENLDVSSKNNIGVANMTFDYAPVGANVTPYTKFNFQTNSESGEYRVELMPLNYEIVGGTGLQIASNAAINTSIIASGTKEAVNFASIPPLLTPEFKYPDDTVLEGVPYHFEKSFIYRSTPVLRVTDQTSESELVLKDSNGVDQTISTEGFKHPDGSNDDVLIYQQFSTYQIVLNTFERYENFDMDINGVEDIVPIVDGQLSITNNLAIPESEVIETDANDNSITNYSFIGGVPNTNTPFTRNIDIQYVIEGVSYSAENYISDGIILGGARDGSQSILSEAPEIPDIILRDPPGSNSFASIEAGESISFTTDNSFSSGGGISQSVKLMLGGEVSIVAGPPGAGLVVNTEVTNSLTGNISVEASSKDGNSITKTYTFNQTISTSDDPEFVGAEGDLYIGNSKNYSKGSFDDFQATLDQIGDPSDNFELTNGVGDKVYLNKQKAFYLGEKPTNTFFVYSQKFIITDLIPEYETIVETLSNGGTVENAKPQSWYENQINLWRRIILNNERSKYTALNDPTFIGQTALQAIGDFTSDLQDEINNAQVGGPYESLLQEKLKLADEQKALITSKSQDNITFDSGVGEVSRSIESVVVNTSTLEFDINIEQSLQLELGFSVNKLGIESTTTGFASQAFSASLTEEDTKTTTISYTLKDNDPANVLSVDIINLFDGSGPIFTTVGGRTSCPYEGPELSHYYNHATYNPNNPVIELAQGDRETLSNATEKAEDPKILVEVSEIFNIPESNNAEFKLQLSNNADATSDAASFNYFELIVDNLTNPDNALINVSQNGTVVFVPYGQTVEYTLTLGKSVSDVNDYEDIRVILQSQCDPVNVFDDVLISAHFVPSCSQVAVKAPLDNWVYNVDAAFNNDGSTNPLAINVSEYNQAFNNFKKIDLEYRLATSPNWTRLHTYYNTQVFYDEAVANSESEISLITDAEVIFAFDIVSLQLQDGNYEIRARSTCTNDTEFISDVISGSIDLQSPQQFGTPLPTDGILGPGEDLRVSFNENIFYNSAVSTIEIKGETNQLPIDHSVSLRFEGANNTATIESPRLVSGDLTVEFWMNNATTASTATVISQQNGLNIRLENGDIYATLGDITANGTMVTDGLFHHYTITHNNASGSLSIYEDDRDIGGATGIANTQFTNNNPLVIGGNTFIGNIHDLRLWTKSISLSEAFANIYTKLLGNENSLVGYWAMNEGRGTIANDLARFKHAAVSADWDIKPKGTSYEFANGQYLELDNVGFVQLTNTMDATISFWIKTDTPQEATIFSNGRGKGGGTPQTSDPVQSNGFANKWAINMNSSGALYFASEENEYVLTAESVADNNWHHITLLFNRNGSLRTYVDAQQVSSNPITDIGGFSGNQAWIGVRGFKDQAGVETVDRVFTGKIDEFRLWNTLRNVDQISRDRFNEMDVESIGLLLYARMNEPDPVTANGPRYYHAFTNQSVIPSNAVLNLGTVNYSDDVPAIKPERKLIKFQVNHVINEDDMILEPVISDWAALEGQILDITVHRMFDASNNMQQSPITWTAFVQKNEMSWFVDGFNEVVDIVKTGNESPSFEITIINKGGLVQPYNISGVPNWLSLSSKSGSLAPDSKVTITATIDASLSVGEYIENLYLQTDFGLDEKLQLEVRVLAEEPAWEVDPNDFDFSMNIVGRIKIDGIFSDDEFDRIAAFVNGETRGVANIVYNESYQEYFVFLTVYSNTVSGEAIAFSIWDATKGQIMQSTLDGNASVTFVENNVIGSLSNPAIFENTNVVEQDIALNAGWTWVSFNVNDANFSNLNVLTSGMNLQTSDRILSHSPTQLETYFKDNATPANSSWNGAISANSGLSTNFMYKMKFANQQSLKLKGSSVDVSAWSFNIQENWNWLPYPLNKNVSVNEALATFDVSDGDIIKSQNLFAIYDPLNGWSGTLSYLETGKGYMVKSSKDQTFKYANIFGKSSNTKASKNTNTAFVHKRTEPEFAKYSENMNAVVLLPEGYHELFIYDEDGVLKGEATNQIVDDKALSFITIYGERPEALTFHVGNGNSQRPTQKVVTFKSNTVLGTVAVPLVLESDILESLKMYPNPFKNELMLQLNSNEVSNMELKLFNVVGQLVHSETHKTIKGQNTIKLTPRISNGIYFLKVNLNNVNTTYRIIKN
ncbi:LamG-like jellyroll fold domain-containing protein [Jejuia spongiicola]|uniref:T9SS type A sorting domain-containing protein n=1 Tax=Jejuia spongiicola TaxID=2942207 RepID=A0ABT0QFT0_9FLAO|nr:LamG-like jellyroll fold domain-containing protein [Jejuia spongiicola]MCL6295857.1 T9SS type A sorting domain-containing protein [Jejuia spongiicola]